MSEIIVDISFNARDELNKELINEYKDNFEFLPPITVYDTPRGKILTDGFHRLSAAKQLNLDTIEADLRQGSIQEAFTFSRTANLKRGLPLTKKEKERAVKDYIKANVKRSDRAIAQEVGYGKDTIGRYRKQLEADGEIEMVENREGLDGRVINKVTVANATVETEVETEPEDDPPDPYAEWFNSHVICGDTFEILPTLNRKFDLIIADPPYGITEEKWDKIDVLNFTRRWLNLALATLKPTGRMYIFFSREYLFELKPLFDEIKYEYPLNFGGMLIWNYRNAGSMPSNRKTYKMTWEPIFYFYGLEAEDLHLPSDTYGEDKSATVGDAQMDFWAEDVMIEAIPQSNFNIDKRVHPTQKPVAVYKKIIETGSNPGDSILDPFGGAGTTGHAALELGREFLLIEQEETYIEIIQNRLKPIWEEVTHAKSKSTIGQ